MKTKLMPALAAALAMLFALPAAAQTAVPAETVSGAKSLRGLNTLHVEYRDSVGGAAEEAESDDPMDDPQAFLMDLLKSQTGTSSASRSNTLQSRVEAALQSRTSIKLHEGTLAEAEAAGIPYLVVTVLRKEAAGKKRRPHDVTFRVHQQVQLARDASFRFYAPTFRSTRSDNTGQVLVRATLDAETSRFVDLWKAAN